MDKIEIGDVVRFNSCANDGYIFLALSKACAEGDEDDDKRRFSRFPLVMILHHNNAPLDAYPKEGESVSDIWFYDNSLTIIAHAGAHRDR